MTKRYYFLRLKGEKAKFVSEKLLDEIMETKSHLIVSMNGHHSVEDLKDFLQRDSFKGMKVYE